MPEKLQAIYAACIQAVANFGRELWWDPNDVAMRDNLQLIFNPQARSAMHWLLMTPQQALRSKLRLTPAPVIFDSRQE
jgi:hypothetical protein